MRNFLKLAALAMIATACSSNQENGYEVSASSNGQFYNGEAVVYYVKDYIYLSLRGEEMTVAIYNHMKDIDVEVVGEDGEYTASKSSPEFSCSGWNSSPDGDLDAMEDLSCRAKISEGGVAGVKDNDVWALSNATAESEITGATFYKSSRSSYITIYPGEGSQMLFDGMVDVNEDILNDPDEDGGVVSEKVGKDILCEYNGTDGDDYTCDFNLNSKGLMSPK